jgi:hypothetical protein
MPNGILMNGLRRNDGAMKNYGWYHKKATTKVVAVLAESR